MNIFITDENPRLAAINLDDKRVCKMILESAQMMSTAIIEHGGKAPYKATHRNHPCNVWVRESRANYWWLLQHFVWLCDEYTFRYGKIHKSLGHLTEFTLGASIIPVNAPTDFVNCAAHNGLGLSFKSCPVVTEAYRQYLSQRWDTDKREPKWTGRQQPKWRS